MSVCDPPGASCSTLPMRESFGIEIEPASGSISPRINRNSVVLPAPLRPTSPTRAPVGSAAVAESISRRSPIR